MAVRPSAPLPAAEEIDQPHVERQPDFGNVVHVACRNCGEPNVLDPARMERQKGGVFLLCQHCDRRFLVRNTDIHRPDPGWVASLYTAALPPSDTDTEAEPPPPRKRLLRRS